MKYKFLETKGYSNPVAITLHGFYPTIFRGVKLYESSYMLYALSVLGLFQVLNNYGDIFKKRQKLPNKLPNEF